MPHLSNYPPGVTGLEPEIVGYPETDIVVNTADESITDLANAVVVMDWAWNDDMDNDDAVLYATAHGKSIAALVAFVQKVASMETIDDVVANVETPGDPDQELEAEQDYKHNLPDEMEAMIAEARSLV